MDNNEQQPEQHGDSSEISELNDVRQRHTNAEIQIGQLKNENFLLKRKIQDLEHENEKLNKIIYNLQMIHNDKTLSMDSRIALSDKYIMPQLGLGTWRIEPEKVQNIIKEGILNCGYRLIDTAWIYQNEHEVGNGIHEAIEQSQGQIKREDLFITTKLWNQHHASDDVEWALRDSLKKLRLNYVDLYLIHWPVAFKNMSENIWSQNKNEKTCYFAENGTLTDTWKAMEKLV
ncbi:unnamed protein product, partial [Rotaria sp. Silwood2]